MRKILRFIGVIFLAACLVGAGNPTGVQAQAGQPWQYFPDTGHSVSGDFWTYYQSVPNASLVFGLPITEQFTDAKSGRIIQYFQRARFEYYQENAPDHRVVLTALGLSVFKANPPGGAIISSSIVCPNYKDTGVPLCLDFLKFYEKNGGEAVFGKPVSPFVSFNGRIAQYFERALFEWYPEYSEGQKVVLAQLGRIVFDLLPENANRLQPLRGDNAPSDIRFIQTRAFALKAMTHTDDEQTLYVVVQDQILNPVAGASAVVTVTWPQGDRQSFAQSTNSDGVVILTIPVKGQGQGHLVTVDAQVVYMGLSSQTATSFRIWQ